MFKCPRCGWSEKDVSGKYAKAILEYRHKNNLTQTELASKLMVTKMSVIRWEKHNGIPHKLVLERMQKTLGIVIEGR